MDVVIFGKLNCGKCAGAKERVSFCIDKMGLAKAVPMQFVNLDTFEGRAEGAFYDVYDAVPVTIVRDDAKSVLSRWEGIMPKSEELKAALAVAPIAEQGNADRAAAD
jgi:hypothetical protein